MIEFLLASASPRRRQILENLGIKFQILHAPDVSEDSEMNNADLTPEEISVALAIKKSQALTLSDTQLALTADTVVAVDGKTFGKPVDDDQARYFLKNLSGRKHQVITALALKKGNDEIITAYESTDVYFTKMSESDIDWYISTKEPFGKAGGYAIQGMGGIFIPRIEGCYFNVVGLPVFCLIGLLKKSGYDRGLFFDKPEDNR